MNPSLLAMAIGLVACVVGLLGTHANVINIGNSGTRRRIFTYVYVIGMIVFVFGTIFHLTNNS